MATIVTESDAMKVACVLIPTKAPTASLDRRSDGMRSENDFAGRSGELPHPSFARMGHPA